MVVVGQKLVQHVDIGAVADGGEDRGRHAVVGHVADQALVDGIGDLGIGSIGGAEDVDTARPEAPLADLVSGAAQFWKGYATVEGAAEVMRDTPAVTPPAARKRVGEGKRG